jgi:hypothetical protein
VRPQARLLSPCGVNSPRISSARPASASMAARWAGLSQRLAAAKLNAAMLTACAPNPARLSPLLLLLLPHGSDSPAPLPLLAPPTAASIVSV